MAGNFNIETDYKPWASLGGFYQGENAGYNETMQGLSSVGQFIENAKNMQEVELYPEKLAIQRLAKEAYAKQVEQMNAPKPDKLGDRIKEREQNLLNSRAGIAALMSDPNINPELVYSLIDEVNPDFGKRVRQSKDPMAVVKGWLQATGEQNKNVSTLMGKNVAADASRNVAEIGFHKAENVARILAASRERAAQISADSSKAGKNLSPGQAYALSLMEQRNSGKITQDQYDDLLLLGLQSQQSKPAPGMDLKVTPDKATGKNKVELVPGTPPKTASDIKNNREVMADFVNNKLSTGRQKPVADPEGWVVINGVKVRKKQEGK